MAASVVEEAVEPRRSGALNASLALLTLGTLASFGVTAMRPASEPLTMPASETSRTAPSAAAAPAASAPPPSWPADVPWIAPTVATAVPASSAPAGPRPIEDIVASATPAVVLVETQGGRGTGFFIAADRIVTNAHVVQQSGYVTIVNATGARVSARVATVSPSQDLALLVPADNAPQGQAVLPLGSIGEVRVGEEVLAIGSPLGFQNTVTRGIVSALRHSGDVVLVQTDAAINPGNSGGPLLDRAGRVIAVTTMKVSGSAESLGFGVAADHVRALVEGRPTTAAPSMGGALAPQPSSSSDDDAADARSSGETQYERAMAQVARRADALDTDWDRFVESCLAQSPRTTGDRPFFALWERSFSESAVAPSCSSSYRRFRTAADDVRTAMSMTDEVARRAGVYPGTRREIRERYRLSWDGWDR